MARTIFHKRHEGLAALDDNSYLHLLEKTLRLVWEDAMRSERTFTLESSTHLTMAMACIVQARGHLELAQRLVPRGHRTSDPVK